jgi:hypothetical protein
MPKAVVKFGDDISISGLRSLCFTFKESFQKRPGGQYLKFRDEIGTEENPGRIVKEYRKTATNFKKANDLQIIDCYKIAALYIHAFLKYQPFYLNNPKNSEYDKTLDLANEYFTIPLLAAIFDAWNEGTTHFKLELTPRFNADFLEKLPDFKKADISTQEVVNLSDTIYAIKQTYFVESLN